MKTFNIKFSFLLLFFLLLLSSLSLHAVLPTDDDNRRTFSNVSINGSKSINVRGNILLIGNQLLCENTADGATCQEPTVGVYNNSINQHKVRIDTSAGSPTNNSWAKLSLEDGTGTLTAADEIVFARLYWSARIDQTTVSAAERDAARKIQIKGPSSTSYTALTSDDDDMNWFKSSSQFDYSASVDVTDYVKTNRAGNYYVGGIQATNGKNKFASWALIVIVENTQRDFNNITIFDGFQAVHGQNGAYPNSVTVPASGFLTPVDEDVDFRASLFVYTGESEAGLDDSAEIQNSAGTWSNLTDGYNDTNDVFNASIYTPEGGFRSLTANAANPNFQNVVGTDIDKLEINRKNDPSKQFLSNSQTSTKIRISSSTTNADRYTLNMFAFETELYIPQFCYDYAYSQQEIYFTENNDGSQDPKIVGDVIIGEPVEVKIFIRNLVSDFALEDMTVNITDINTTQATYVTDSTKLAKIGTLYPLAFNDLTDLNVTTSSGLTSVQDVDIGTMGTYEHFYVYYSIDPQQTLDMPININATYNLVLSPTKKIPYTLNLGANVPMCSNADFAYSPAKGIFNIVHNDYYDWSGVPGTRGISYYNIPTQVTKRIGNFKVISLDPDNLDEHKSVSTIAAIELIDASAFHDVNASCQELSSSVSDRVWVTFENNTTSTLFNNSIVPPDFYNVARQNTAFRTSYNVTNDGNESLVEISESAGYYYIDNYTKVIGGRTTCSQGMGAIDDFYNCREDGDPLYRSTLENCMECLYGYNTKLVCSRDNFAIRPEAILIHIDDQNQSNSTIQTRLTTGESGIVGATTSIKNLSADYRYNLELNATNHIDNNSSFGYTRSFNIATLSDSAEYTWEPRTLPLPLPNSCNNDINQTLDIRFVNGVVDTDSSVQEVGEYKLHLLDTTWTAVDGNAIFMKHHTGSHFSNTYDCTRGSSTTYLENTYIDTRDSTALANSLTGCNVSSTHTNPTTKVKYNDYNVTFHPYEFTITTALSLGLNKISPPPLKPFVYMANIALDENMSVDISSSITARGKNSTTALSNFVTGCFAKPLDINISKSATQSTQLEYKYALLDLNSSGTSIIANKLNGSIAKGNTLASPTFTTSSSHFQKDMGGRLTTRALLNFNKETNASANPENITFGTFSVSDPNTANTFNADLLTLQNADNNVTLNQSVIHYYARTAARSSVKIVCDGTNPCLSGPPEPDIFIYYEVFCNKGILNGNTCNDTSPLLPTVLGFQDAQSVHSHWWTSFDHNTTSFGALSDTNGTGGAVSLSGILNPDGLNYKLNPVHSYDLSNGLPYTAAMKDTVPSWLIYDETNAGATHNFHYVEFRARASWSGEHETNTTTKTKFIRRVNRRTMW